MQQQVETRGFAFSRNLLTSLDPLPIRFIVTSLPKRYTETMIYILTFTRITSTAALALACLLFVSQVGADCYTRNRMLEVEA